MDIERWGDFRLSWRDKPRPGYLEAMDDSEWRNASLAERTLHVAASQVGVRESSANWGPMVRAYLKVAGLFSPAPWCAAFVTWCLVEAGADRKRLPRFAASTYYWWRWSKTIKHGPTKPDRGCIGLYNNNGAGHIWLWTSSEATIEGNTNDNGSREGIGVFRRIRRSTGEHDRTAIIEISDSWGVGA